MKISITQVSHYNTFHFLRYAHFNYAICLFTSMQIQYNTLKSSLRFKKVKRLPVNNLIILKKFMGITFLGKQYIQRLPNLH